MVIPTPGPLSVAGTLGVNFGWFILYSLIVSIPGALIGGWLYGEFLGKKLYKYEEPVGEAATQSVPAEKNDTKRAPAGLAIAIIALPLLLIVFGTLIPMWTSNPMAVSVCKFLTAGNGVISLIISVAFAALTLRPYVKGSYAPLITKNFNEMGEIMLLLGAGGSFGAIIQASGIGNYFVTLLQSWNVPLIVLAFLLCLLMRSALGSAPWPWLRLLPSLRRCACRWARAASSWVLRSARRAWPLRRRPTRLSGWCRSSTTCPLRIRGSRTPLATRLPVS